DLGLRMQLWNFHDPLALDSERLYDLEYPLEERRGYPHRDKLWSPGEFSAALQTGQSLVLSASTETWEALAAADPQEALYTELERRSRLIEQADPQAREGLGAELVLAADQFVIEPSTRLA